MPTELEEVAREICTRNSYAFQGRVGEGAFKETFHVAIAGGESRALKVFKQAQHERTEREIDAMQRCEHPNVSRLHFVSTFVWNSRTHVFLVEEFLSGGTLQSRMERALLPASELRDLARHLIGALSSIASQKLVHRDIKPENILLREDGRTPVIVDFGIVRNLDATSLTPTWVPSGPGTPYYSSPEQLRNAKPLIDWRSDQFSLGIVLAICSLNLHPYAREADDPIGVVQRVASGDGPSPDFIAAAFENGLSALIRMTQPYPIQRFRVPRELAEAWAV